MIKVVNKRTHKPSPDAIDEYIGRGSGLGNPFTHIKRRMTLAKYVVESPEKALAMYEGWLPLQLANPKSAASIQFRHIVKLAEKYDVNLVCFCAPNRCHGDFVKKLIDNLINK